MFNAASTPVALGLRARSYRNPSPVIDILTLALTHGLMVLAALVLISRGDLDDEEAGDRPAARWQRPRIGDAED